ncbi:uncharacterized protein LOC142337051 [Convolutriloba macropyga]|uniref:uncharacterized protein LOC142337051 n=1 Tax=Convolutriloba macropyga TaxID=536237 RepID=UPI003F51D2D1
MASYKPHKINEYFNAVEDTVKEFFGEWEWIFSAKNRLPYCAGMFKIGHQLGGGGGSVGEVEVVYIGHTTQDRTLREVISSMLHGFEGGERLSMFLVDPVFKKDIMLQWVCSVYPEELIEDELEEYLATHHKVPEYNDPLEENKGIWVVTDEDGHPSNTIAGDYD